MKIFTLFTALVFIGAIANAQTKTRLIGEAFYGGTGAHFAPVDSGAYYYNDPLLQNDPTRDAAYVYNNGAYDSDEIYLYSYNALGLVDTFRNELWSNYHQAYENYLLYQYFYNASNYDTTLIAQKWDSTAQQWNNYSKNVYTHDANGNELSQTVYSWTSKWVPSEQYGYTYNSHNKVTSLTVAYWTGSAWDTATSGYYDRIIFNYNALGEDTLGMSLYYNFTDKVWDTTNRFLLVFDKHNTLDSLETVQNWVSAGTWQNANLNIDEYDANGNLTTFYGKIANGNSWLNYEQQIDGYNSYNDLTSEITTYWNSDSSFYEDTKSAYERFWHFDTYTGVNQLTVDRGQLTVYPNPSSDFIHISATLKQTDNLQLRLVNMLGQQVWSANEGNGSHFNGNISVANLPSGVYLLQMLTGDGVQTERMVVEK